MTDVSVMHNFVLCDGYEACLKSSHHFAREFAFMQWPLAPTAVATGMPFYNIFVSYATQLVDSTG